MGWFLLIVVLVNILVRRTTQNTTSSNNDILNDSYSKESYSQRSYNNYESNTKAELEFHSKNDTIELFGYNITGSMFYTCGSKSNMPFAINISSNPDFRNLPTRELGYWPNYNQIEKSQQGYFIKWLASGKPYIEELGYVYIYYYGLEYRALIEGKDLRDVLFEVVDLVNKFERLRYGYDFIAFLTLRIKNFNTEEANILLKFFKNYEHKYIFNPVYYSIIKILNSTMNNKFIDRFSLYQTIKNSQSHCFNGGKDVLLQYYFNKVTEKLDNLDLYTTASQIYSYHMANYYGKNPSNTISSEVAIPSATAKRIWEQGYKIIKNDTNQIVKKFNGTNEQLTEIEILTYLPKKLRKNICFSLDNFDFGEKAFSSIETIANKLGFNLLCVATMKQSSLIVDACDALGYEVEPSANIELQQYTKDAIVVIYKNPYEGDISQSNYNVAALFTDIGYQVALEDQELLPVEIAYIRNYIEKEFKLSPSEKYRLQMRGELIVHKQKISTRETIKKLIRLLDNNGRETIAKYLISVAMADGIVKDSELRILQKIFKQLDFSEDYLYSTLSKLIDDSGDKVVVVKKAETTARKGSKIPKYIEPEEKIELKLSKEKLEKIKINTSEIHNVLQEIFADEQVDAMQSEVNEDVSTDSIDSGTESNLYNLINLIIEKDHWTRNELLNIIQNRGMMLNSAIDAINELTEEQYGDFLIEEDDSVYLVNSDVVNLIKNKE